MLQAIHLTNHGATRLGIMRQGKRVHTLQVADMTAADFQTLYLETIKPTFSSPSWITLV